MISATAWIAKGKSARHPTKYSVDDSELERVAKLANVHFEDAKAQFERAQRVAAGWEQGKDGHALEGEDAAWEDEEGDGEDTASDDGDQAMDTEAKVDSKPEDPNDLSRYNLDAYDEDEGATDVGPFSNIKGLQYYRNNDEDPYITMKNDANEDEEEREDLEVQPNDNLIVCAKTEDEVSMLEAYLYTPNEANLYVHHDLMLPSFPLCLEWLDYKPAGTGADQNSTVGQVGNFVAVGTMDPEIEIWSMDVVEGLFPDALLGRRDMTERLNEPKGTGKKKRKQLKDRVPNATYHVDAVLSLSWNRVARNLLGSASADTTIKLWDLSRPAETTSTSGGAGALRSFDDLHTDKVQSLAWDTSNSSRGAIGQPARLLSGSYDKTLCVFDSRASASAVRARITADVEAIRWNPWREHNFIVSMEDGIVQAFDARMLTTDGQGVQTVFTLSAHDGACTSLDVSPHVPGCMITGGTDKLVKLWNMDAESYSTNDTSTAWRPSSISLVASRNLDAGKIFSTQFSPDDPLTIVAAGSKGTLRVWDALANMGARKTFGDRLRDMPASLATTAVRIDGDEPARGDGVVRLADESDEEDDVDEVGAIRGGDGDAMMEG